MRQSLLSFVAMVLLSSSVAARHAPPHSASWVVAANSMPSGYAKRTKDGYFVIGTVVPAKLFRPADDVAVVVSEDRSIIIPRDRLMLRISDDPRSFCELRSSRGSAFDCLTDTDADGKTDTFFGTQVFNEIFLGSFGDDGGFTPLARPVSLVEVSPKTDVPDIKLEIKYYSISGNMVKYRICTNASWKSKYFDSRSCVRNLMKSQVDSTGSALIYGQKIRFEAVRGKPQALYVDYGREGYEFSTTFSMF